MIDVNEIARPETREQPTAAVLNDNQIEGLLLADAEPVGTQAIVTESASGSVLTRVTRTPIGRVVMFSPAGLRREISTRDVKTNYREGWTFRCQACGKGDCGGIFGGCEKRPTEAFMRCPIESCGRILRDRQLKDAPAPNRGEQIGEEIAFAPNTSPKDRLTERLRRHMLKFHPAESSLYGFFPDGTRQTNYLDQPAAQAPAHDHAHEPATQHQPARQSIQVVAAEDGPTETMSLDEMVDRYPAPLNPKNPEGYAYVCGVCGTGHKNAFALNKHISSHKADQ